MGCGRTETLRSDFLIHWTGRDINPDYRTLTGEQCEQYVSRLRDTLIEEPSGLWMNRNEEAIEVIPGVCRLAYRDTPMTCFTEIKLSSTYEHTLRYGCLGLGFSRRFVMDLFGAPVHYVTGDRRDKVTLDLAWVANQLSILRDTGGARPVPENGARTLFGEMYDRLKSVACLLKPMSDSPDDYRNLDESEWRILYYPNEQERIRFLGDDSIPPAKITFEPADLEIIVFPNNETRTMALSSIMGWFGEPPDLPIMVTVAECLNF